jgi:hypothetical protein
VRLNVKSSNPAFRVFCRSLESASSGYSLSESAPWQLRRDDGSYRLASPQARPVVTAKFSRARPRHKRVVHRARRNVTYFGCSTYRTSCRIGGLSVFIGPKCVDCSKPVSKVATRCPDCDRALRRKALKTCRCGALLRASTRTGLCRKCWNNAKQPTKPRPIVPHVMRARPLAPRRAVLAPKPAPVPIVPDNECPAHHMAPVALLSDPDGGSLYRCPVSHCRWFAWRYGGTWEVIDMPTAVAA